MRHARMLALSLCLAALGCGETTIPGAQLWIIEGVVNGTVTATGGAAVAAATVTATAQYPLSSGSLAVIDSVLTDNAGHYQIILAVGNLADARAPLEVQVRPPTGSLLGTRDTTGLTIMLARAVPPAESTHVDVVLP
jgi:hypothetical protein